LFPTYLHLFLESEEELELEAGKPYRRWGDFGPMSVDKQVIRTIAKAWSLDLDFVLHECIIVYPFDVKLERASVNHRQASWKASRKCRP
jgi:hypothetical protein